MKQIIQWWLTPKFPAKHIGNVLNYKPEGITSQIRNFYRTWLIHPIKRRIAKYYLSFLKLLGLKVIGITGSAGKTTTKEMVASILEQDGQTIYSVANIDPIYNIPTTILKCSLATKYLVLEMGIEYPGEMDFYLWLAKPDIGVITNIGATHLEFLGDIAGVAMEKAKLVSKLRDNDRAVLNATDNKLVDLGKKLKSRVIWFGKEGAISAKNIMQTEDFKTRFELNIEKDKLVVQIPFLGNHFVQNALAASGVADALGIRLTKIKQGLELIRKPEHRMNFVKSNKGYLIIDDTYNANPLAVKQTLKTFSTLNAKGKKIFVFGEMKELGDLAISSHREVGNLITKSDIDVVLTFGRLTKFVGGKSEYFESQQELIMRLRQLLRAGDIVLVKGSRSMKMEAVVEAIK